MYLVDTHVHLNFEVFQADIETIRARWQAAGVGQLVHSCVAPNEFEQIQAIAHRFPEVFFAVGLHPLDVQDCWHPNLVAQLQTLAAADAKVVAIGETGLDFYKADNVKPQEDAFLAQVAIARQLNKPVIIHCRDAAAPMAQLLERFWAQEGPVPGVMHCWGGTPEETQWFLDLGFYISFSGTVTFKKATAIQASAQMVPSDRLLVETDCPFLAPTPKRGQRNEPAYVRYVAEYIAQLRGIATEALATQTSLNACQLFGLPRPAELETPLLV